MCHNFLFSDKFLSVSIQGDVEALSAVEDSPVDLGKLMSHFFCLWSFCALSVLEDSSNSNTSLLSLLHLL